MPVRAFNTRILVDQFDFSLKTKGVMLAFSIDQMDANTLQSSDDNNVPDVSSAMLELNGYFDGPGTGQLEQELYARLGNNAVPCIVTACFDTSVLGNPAYSQQATWGQELIIDGSDKLLMVRGKWEDITQRGLVIAQASIAAIGDQPVIDFGAAGTLGGWATIHVRAISGVAVGATFTVKSSTVVGFTAPVTHGTFTVSAVGAQRLAFSGAVGRYVRLGCASLGGATSFDVTALAGTLGVTG